jgi:prevent-host-death family protein
MTNTKVTSSEARAKFRDLLDRVLTGKGDVIIERNGQNIAVLIPAVDYEEIQDMLEELRAAREASAAHEEWKRNPNVARPWEDVEAELDESK